MLQGWHLLYCAPSHDVSPKPFGCDNLISIETPRHRVLPLPDQAATVWQHLEGCPCTCLSRLTFVSIYVACSLYRLAERNLCTMLTTGICLFLRLYEGCQDLPGHAGRRDAVPRLRGIDSCAQGRLGIEGIFTIYMSCLGAYLLFLQGILLSPDFKWSTSSGRMAY
jgi:hypothetical protein